MPSVALERWYLPLQKAGVIAITEQPGAAKKIAVTVTAEGGKKNVSDDPGMLAMRQGVPKIDKITRNEAVHRGADDYRIVGAQYIANWEDAVADVLAYCGNPVTPEQKSVVLLNSIGRPRMEGRGRRRCQCGGCVLHAEGRQRPPVRRLTFTIL